MLMRLRQLLRRKHVSCKDGVCIFSYHGVVEEPLDLQDWCFLEASEFRWQMENLIRNFDVIPLSEAIGRLKNNTIDGPTAVMTFDDGLQNNYDVALPILRELKVPATIFLTTGLMGSDDTLWNCRLLDALAKTTAPAFQWNGNRYRLESTAAKASASVKIQRRLKAFPQPELMAELRVILLALGASPDARIPSDSPYRMLGIDSIERMSESGLIEFGAHSESHAILSLLSTEECRREINLSIEAVERMTGKPCRLFAFPNGRAQDYNDDCLKILEECGIQAAVTAIRGCNDRTTPPLELQRISVGTGTSRRSFSAMMPR